jgi:nucleoid-associated protein YgaU
MHTMAAIFDTTRPANLPPRRPALRLVTDDGAHTALVPVELGLRTVHLVVAVAAFVLLLLASLAIGNGALAGLAPAPAGAGASSAPTAAAEGIAVQQGDTLWTIARRLQPTGDVRPLVDQLLALNGSAALQPGQVVQVPA